MTEQRTVSTPTAMALTGATVRQLDYWAKTGLLVPTVEAKGSGSQRRYSYADCSKGARLAALSCLAPERQGLSKGTAHALATDGRMVGRCALGEFEIVVDLVGIDDALSARWQAMFAPETNHGKNQP